MAQGGGGGGGQPQGDSAYGPLWITVLLMIVVLLVWRYAHNYIVYILFQINIVEAKIVDLFIDSDTLSQYIYLMQTVDVNQVNWQELVAITASVGEYFRYPVIAIILVLAVILYKSNTTMKFRKTYSMKSLRAQEQEVWPAIMPVVKEDLVKQDINEGPWAMALSPLEFGYKFNLLKKDDLLLDTPAVPGAQMTAGLRKGDAKRVFTLQLGPYWEGFERLPGPAYALAAVFMARINRDRDGADFILKQIDISAANGKPDFSVARPYVEKFKNSELVQKAIAPHGYMLTALASLLEAAREDGVVPSSEFLWLKVVDRRMWYMLNCIGRQTPYVEVAGPFAHWKAEKSLGRKSVVPLVDEAIKALELAIKEVKLNPTQLEELLP